MHSACEARNQYNVVVLIKKKQKNVDIKFSAHVAFLE